jgi:hypothetical protein
MRSLTSRFFASQKGACVSCCSDGNWQFFASIIDIFSSFSARIVSQRERDQTTFSSSFQSGHFITDGADDDDNATAADDDDADAAAKTFCGRRRRSSRPINGD